MAFPSGTGTNTTSPSRRRTSNRLPSLKFEELGPPPAMATASPQQANHSPGQLIRPAGPASPTSGTTQASTALLTPLPNGSTARRASSTHEISSSPPASTNNNNISTLHTATFTRPSPSPTPEPPSDNPQQWSSAIGHASTTGKSGRVIERLMAENDRLKRELSAQLAQTQELQRNLQTHAPLLENLRSENDTLKHVRGVDETLLARRDRRVEELKAEVAGERARRAKAESRVKEVEAQGVEAEEARRREGGRLEEEAKHAVVQAGILETSHRQLRAEYELRAQGLRKEMSGVQARRGEDLERLERLEVVGELMRKEVERNGRLTQEVVEVWERYKSESEGVLEELKHMGEGENETVRKLSTEMDRVVGEMRWIMGIEKVRRGDSVADGLGVGMEGSS